MSADHASESHFDTDFSERFRKAEFLRDEGDFTQARILAQELLGLSEQKSGLNSLTTASALILFADIQRALGETSSARDNYRRSLDTRIAMVGLDSGLTAESMNRLANVLKDYGDYPSAQNYYEHAIEIWTRHFGANHRKTLAGIHDLGLLFMAADDYPNAKVKFEESLRGFETHYGEEDRETLQCRDSYGQFLLTTGNPLAAKEHFQAVLESRRRLLGTQHPDVADSLNNLGWTLYELADYEIARSHLQEALENYKLIFGERHAQVANVLNNLAIVTHRYYSAELAIELLENSLCIYEGCGEAEILAVARLHDNLGGLHTEAGRYVEASRHLEIAYSIRSTNLGRAHGDTLTSLGRLALLWQTLELFKKAVLAHHEVLEGRRKLFGDRHRDTMATLNNLGLCLMDKGDLHGALEYLERGHQECIDVLGEDHPDSAVFLNSLGVLFSRIGDYRRSLIHHEAALAVRLNFFGEQNTETAESLSNLSGVYKEVGRVADAIIFQRRAVNAYSAAAGLKFPGLMVARENLAVLLTRSGEFDEAEALLQQTRLLKSETLSPDHTSRALNLHNLGHLRLEQREFGEAIRYLEEALSILQSLEDDVYSEMSATISVLICAYLNVNRPTDAFQMAQKLAECDDRLLRHVFGFGSDRQRVAVREMVQRHFEETLTLIVNHFANSEEGLTFAFELLLRRKALRLEVLIAQRSAVTANASAQLRELVEELKEVQSKLAVEDLHSVRTGHPTLSESMRQQWIEQVETLESKIARELSEMRAGQAWETSDLEHLSGFLEEDQLLVEFVRLRHFVFDDEVENTGDWNGPDKYLCFTLRKGEEPIVKAIDLGDAATIDASVLEFVKACGTKPALRGHLKAEDLGATVRRRLVDPIIPKPSTISTLLICPDSMIHRVAFSALPTLDGRFLADAYSISYISSGRDVVRSHAVSSGPQSSSIVIADPAFNLSSQQGKRAESPDVAWSPKDGENRAWIAREGIAELPRFWRLKGTRKEGEEIGKLLGVEPLMDQQALVSTVKTSRSPRILHLATHGFFWTKEDLSTLVSRNGISDLTDLEDPLVRAGIALAGVNVWLRGGVIPDEAENGLLTARDVINMELSQTELVVMSACDTGLGDFDTSEGLYGFRRAFVISGAKRLVMSLWKIDDLQTQRLMIEFYTALKSRVFAAEALDYAQKQLRESGFSDPYYWAGFILQGARTPVF